MATSSSLSVILNEVKNLSRSKRVGLGKPVRWIAAPQSSLTNAPAVHGVMLAPNESVQWAWTHTANDSYVSGYKIIPVLPKKRQRPFASLKVTTWGGERRKRGANYGQC